MPNLNLAVYTRKLRKDYNVGAYGVRHLRKLVWKRIEFANPSAN